MEELLAAAHDARRAGANMHIDAGWVRAAREAAFEDETARLVRRCWALFKKWKPSGRLDDYTETKSHVILGSLQKAGANAKDLANAGALMLNFAREIQDKQDGIKALKLSARASELALEMNPGNSQAQSNLAAARNNLQHMY